MSISYNQSVYKNEKYAKIDNQKIEKLALNFKKAKNKRDEFEDYWEECYSYIISNRNLGLNYKNKTSNHIFDGTASDAVDQLAASLISELTPPWSTWFGLTPGKEVNEDALAEMNPLLDAAEKVIQTNFDRSNFNVEIHQCYLDLVISGNATLLFEEGEIGDASAFKFKAIPIEEMYLDESENGKLDITFRKTEMNIKNIINRFDDVILPKKLEKELRNNDEKKVGVIEAVFPDNKLGYSYTAFIEDEYNEFTTPGEYIVLKEGNFANSPFINFRWTKTSGETYGRSPVMKALPDIKTANKVVELILKNASIAVTGIWQADDDGVINPANIELKPGVIIPKAVGSEGLTPLKTASNFDVSALVLEDLRARIRHALLADKLAPISQKMTATEVLERSAEMSKILGSTYGRLQSELLNPIIGRAVNILKRRGEIPNILLDNKNVELKYKSPLAKIQANKDAENALSWINAVSSLGEQAKEVVNFKEAAKWLGNTLGVPQSLINK